MTNTTSENHVPCEMCGRLIDFDEYIPHLETCYISTRMRNQAVGPSQTIRLVNGNTINDINHLEQTLQNNMATFMNTAFVNTNDQPDFDSIVSLLPTFFNTSNNFNFSLQLHQVVSSQQATGSNASVDFARAYRELTDEELVQNGEETACSVCYETSNKVFVLTNCNHVYCKPCIDAWLAKKLTCPICLNDFS